ncbi:MAG: multicopper oxidase domain-containing protein [Phycisphaerae bacterium]|nr:multicopper oxidase domain-containing protein [Gemmatimonadaceae bacterium]
MNHYARCLIVAPAAAALLALIGPPTPAAERIATNDNQVSAGVLRNGVLTIRLEARTGDWHPDRDTDPGLTVHAFGQVGKPLQIPGPLIRVKAGTVVHVSVRNSLDTNKLVVHGLSAPGSLSPAPDTTHVAPGATRELQFTASTPGTYYYWGTTTGATDHNRPGMDSQLTGVIVVDATDAPPVPRDRIFVIGLWTTQLRGGVIARDDLLRFVMNGRAWPNTERLAYTAGDSVRFRIVNTSSAPHPMHLHGFYFNVDARGNGRIDEAYNRARSPRLVVTDRMPPGGTLALTWVPERSGNWLFHCHDNFHILANRPLDGSPPVAPAIQHATNHAMDMMGGLVLGVEVRPRRGARSVSEPRTQRALRVVVRNDTGGTAAEPAFGYELQDPKAAASRQQPLLPGPTLLLTKNESVAITVVNEIPEPTAVHWHGIELDSYYDGVAGFAGRQGRIAPVIAPRDSFVARFTPPRAGTFIYHPHADELRQQQGGLSGAIIVLEPGRIFNADEDIVLLISTPRREVDGNTVLLNGTNKPETRSWRVGQRYRLRLIDIHTARPSMTARMFRDSTLLSWRAIAKDGMDLPADQATVRPAQQLMGNGETYDFEFTPTSPGNFRLAITAQTGLVLVTMPIVVRP